MDAGEQKRSRGTLKHEVDVVAIKTMSIQEEYYIYQTTGGKVGIIKKILDSYTDMGLSINELHRLLHTTVTDAIDRHIAIDTISR